jgi:hypothetical protein
MSGQNRVEANRHNAQLSTGPQTASGKTAATLKLAEQSQFSARTERRMRAPAAQGEDQEHLSGPDGDTLRRREPLAVTIFRKRR